MKKAEERHRVQTIAALRRVAATEPRFTYGWLRRHNRALLRDVLLHFGDIATARDAARLRPLEPKRKWSLERVVEELKQTYRSTRALTLCALRAAGRADIVSAAARYGGIVYLRGKAGLPEPAIIRSPPSRWDAERVVSEIIDIHAAGGPLARSKVPRTLVAAANRHLGSWAAAIEAAGMDYDEIRLARAPYTKDDVLDLLRELARTRPKMLWSELYEHSAQAAMIRYYGSVRRAVKAAGVKDWPMAGNQDWSRAKVVRTLRETQRDSARPADATLAEAARWYAGGVTNARQVAGVSTLRQKWTRDRVFADLRKLAREGSLPGRNLAAACSRLFGGVTAARDAAGIAPPPPLWSRERVLSTLHERATAGDLTIRGPLADACHRYFGSVRAARSAAGIDRPSSAQWTKPRVIAVLRDEYRKGISLTGAMRTAVAKRFGGMRAARAAAGVPAPTRRDLWSAERVVNELRHTVRDNREPNLRLYREARRHFGSMAKARKAAKTAALTGRTWTRDRLLRELAERPAPARKLRAHVREAAERHFGSVDAALQAAGARVQSSRWNQPAVVAEIQRSVQRRKPLAPALRIAARRQFGSVTAAREAAGVPQLQRRWTRATVIAELRQVGARGVSTALQYACERYFGSVAKARDAAGVPSALRTWSREEILRQLRMQWSQSAVGDHRLAAACRRWFGSVAAARSAAKLAPLVEEWNPARVVRLLRERDATGAALPKHAYIYATRIFGSLEAACRAASVPARRSSHRMPRR